MASALHHQPQAGRPHNGSQAPSPAAPTQAPGQPTGIFASGTKVQVGGSRVVIERYLSEGGFAHVYLVKLPKPIGGEDIAVLKRVAVPDKEALANMRTEIETMKKLRGHSKIVTYFDSHASQMQGGGYEVFVLMEYCSGGGLIDFMNTRLQNRLTEPEILKIFSDTVQGVACLHYLKPPLLHRDLKVENILISNSHGAKQFKLCDFGSAAPPRPAASSAAEGRLIEDDVQRHTTMQYRSPEMIDVYRKQPIDEKSDIWALGVFMYKLCYYTTPFEEQGQMAILNATFRFPGYPQFSDRLKRLIALMLQEQPTERPNIYQVTREVCAMRGTEIPIKDIYSARTASESRRNQELPAPPDDVKSPPTIGAVKVVAPKEEKTSLPDITPMRRGRPTKPPQAQQQAPKPSPSPGRAVSSDPFAALDSNEKVSGDSDELASRFPTVDQFSLLHDSGSSFSFDNNRDSQAPAGQQKHLSQRVTEALADDAFATSTTGTAKEQPLQSKSGSEVSGKVNTGTQTSLDATAARIAAKSAAAQASMVSTGTMTSPRTPPTENYKSSPSLRAKSHFAPSDQRASSQPRLAGQLPREQSSSKDGFLTRPSLTNYRSQSQTNLEPVRSSPSMQPTSTAVLPERPSSGRTKNRPISGTFESAAKFFQTRGSPRIKSPEALAQPTSADLNAAQFHTTGDEASRIGSNVDFLRAMEEEENAKTRREKRRSTGSTHSKRSSMPSISLSGTKNLLAGRFGEAFRRFETNTPQSGDDPTEEFLNSADLTPIAGSEATDGRSDDGQVLEETEEMPPEMRRELERRRLSQEEKRVSQAAAAYKQRVATSGGAAGGAGPNGRAMAIQTKVQALLDETGKVSPTRTAAGYGHFTDETKKPQDVPTPTASAPPTNVATQKPSSHAARAVAPANDLPARTASLPNRGASKAAITASNAARPAAVNSGGMPAGGVILPRKAVASNIPPAAAVVSAKPNTTGPRPTTKPKPQALRTGNTGGVAPMVAAKPSSLGGAGLARATPTTARGPVAGLGAGAQGVSPGPLTATRVQSGDGVGDAVRGTNAVPANSGEDEDWETTFSKKYPSLSGLEMVETEIEASKTAAGGERGWRDI